ncbi:hypothetical protein [Sandaracinus amylolyticus]|uniref:hypothetical protein n=1 Tax=Sandaracinus amylolyticus TaxID=927083 RepID=UPI0012EEDDB5|nr:hypothetical protein [Sandaracinus amylolyticus]
MRTSGGLLVAGVLALAFASTGVVPRAVAQEVAPTPTREEVERASVLFERSALAYSEGRFDAAAALLGEAYALSHEPILLYNLGRAHEGARAPERALDAYRLYLEQAPDAENASLVRERVEVIERELSDAEAERVRVRREQEDAAREREAAAERARIAAEQEQALRRAAEQERRRREAEPSPWPWVVGGVGVAGLGAALAVGIVAMERHADAAAAETQVEAVGIFDEAQSLAIGANVGLVVGGVLLGVGVAWGVVDLTGATRHDDEREPQGNVEVTVGPGALGVRGTF